jgi:hypothetical protein
MACMPFFVFPFFLPMKAMARPYGKRDIFCFSLKFWPIGNKGQTRWRASHYLFFPLFCQCWPRPDHMAYMKFFVLDFFLQMTATARPYGMHDILFLFFCLMAIKARLDGVGDIFNFSFFLPMMATARPYGVRDIFCFSLKFWPIGNQGQTRQRA